MKFESFRAFEGRANYEPPLSATFPYFDVDIEITPLKGQIKTLNLRDCIHFEYIYFLSGIRCQSSFFRLTSWETNSGAKISQFIVFFVSFFYRQCFMRISLLSICAENRYDFCVQILNNFNFWGEIIRGFRALSYHPKNNDLWKTPINFNLLYHGVTNS